MFVNQRHKGFKDSVITFHPHSSAIPLRTYMSMGWQSMNGSQPSNLLNKLELYYNSEGLLIFYRPYHQNLYLLNGSVRNQSLKSSLIVVLHEYVLADDRK